MPASYLAKDYRSDEVAALFAGLYSYLLHFEWFVDDAKCIVVTRVCVSVCLFVCLSTAACLHYCIVPDVTWGSDRRCPLVVHYWADLQSGHGLRCYGNITRTRNVSEYMLRVVLGVSQTLRRWIEGATYVGHGDHHVGHLAHVSSYTHWTIKNVTFHFWL